MRTHDLIAAALAAATVACAPRYHNLEPIAPDQLWSPLPTQIVQVQGIDIRTVDSGGDGPPSVLIHGPVPTRPAPRAGTPTSCTPGWASSAWSRPP